MASIFRVATYSRVSTADQKSQSQVDELNRYCSNRGWSVVESVVDHGFSGGSDQRPGLKQLLALVRTRKVDVVVVTKLDRLARSLRHLVTILDEMTSLGVQFVSVGDQIDLGSASGRLMLHIVAAFAEFERALIRERTVAGLAHARAKGKRLGRPKECDDEAIRACRTQGMTHAEIGRALSVSKGAIYRALNFAPQSPSQAQPKTSANSGGHHE